MTIIEEIDQIMGNIDKEKLSKLFIQSADIALELEDYNSWISLMFNINGFEVNKSRDVFEKSIKLVLTKKHISKKKQDELYNEVAKQFVQLRYKDDEHISCHSIKDLERLLENINKQKYIGEYIEVESTYERTKTFFIVLLAKLKTIANNNEQDNIKNIDKYNKKNISNVFIIHGHDEAKRRELYTILKDNFNLNPIVLSEKPNKGKTIIEKFEFYAKTCSYAFALFTPDDIVKKNGKQYFQARPNVIFELGWFFANLGRDRVCILNKESTKNNIFSDLEGILRCEFKQNVQERYKEIKNELIEAKIISK